MLYNEYPKTERNNTHAAVTESFIEGHNNRPI